jgi:predicted secreted protein
MSITTALAVYFLVWWLTLFAVLPWGVRSQHEDGEISPGTEPGAPILPRIAAKLGWTTAVATAVFAVLYVTYVSGIVTFDDLQRVFPA